MQLYQLTNQAGPVRFLAHSRTLLLGVIALIMLMLPVVLNRAVRLSEEMEAARSDVTDDHTWAIAQLEVEYLKLAIAVGDLGSPESGSLSGEEIRLRSPDLMHRFDIFYARVGTVANQVRTWSRQSDRWTKSMGILGRLTDRRNLLADMLDRSVKPGGTIRLDALETAMASLAQDVRELSVSAVANLSAHATAQRLHYIGEQRNLLIQSVAMVFVMAAISVGALVLYRQVGIRAAAERRLSENLFRVFDAKPVAILITDAGGRIRWQNAAAATLLGDALTPEDDLHTLDHYFPGLQRMAREGRTHPLAAGDHPLQQGTFRDVIRRADRGTVAVEVTQIQLMAEGGETTNALFVRDISEVQFALRALRRERRSAETEAERYQRFLAVMSHEIRSPLHAIMAALDLARQRPEAAGLADLHGIAMDAARIVLQEADAVLENGRAEHEMHAAEPGVFSPAKIVADLIDMNGPAAHAAGTRLSAEIGPGADGSIVGLRACFWHAVANLLSNAVKFTRNGTIQVRLSRADATLRVEVSDTGPGVAPERQQAIFRDHYSRDPASGAPGAGAGLGLGLFAEAVQTMSGQYGLESAPGVGSTFWFSFPAPLVEQTQLVEAIEPPASGDLPTDLNVLVVDDSQVNRTLIQQMFASLGLKTDLSESGIEAVKMAQGDSYDLILMDLSMPQMDGFAATAEIRRAGASQNAVIVALTANVLARHVVDKAGSCFDGFLLKPLRLDELRAWLAGGLKRPSQPRGDLAPVIDHPIAQDIVDALPRPSIEALLKAFFDEVDDLVAKLGLGQADEDLSAKFHKIAGSAGMLGAARLRELSLEGETASKTAKHLNPTFQAAWLQTVSETSRAWSVLLESMSNEPPAALER